LVCLQAAWVVVLSRLAGGAVPRRVWTGLAVAFAGVLLVSGVDLTVSARALAGDGLALLGGALAAVYTVVGARVRRTTSTASYTLVCYATSAFSLLVVALVAREQLIGFSAHDWVLVLSVTVTAQLLGHSVFNHLLATMSPTLVSMVLLLEVPGAAMLAAVFLGQAPPVAVYVGLAIICLGLATVVAGRRGGPVPEAVD
jgi:drug/metabolite transporter (DMT)-like permease